MMDEDDLDFDPPCWDWCEMCGCHGYCDDDDEDYPRGDEG